MSNYSDRNTTFPSNYRAIIQEISSQYSGYNSDGSNINESKRNNSITSKMSNSCKNIDSDGEKCRENFDQFSLNQKSKSYSNVGTVQNETTVSLTEIESFESLAGNTSTPKTTLDSHKLNEAMSEIVETEKRFIYDMKSVINVYIGQIDSDVEPIAPFLLKCYKIELFSNFEEIYNFHANTLLPMMESNFNSPLAMAQVFEKKETKFDVYKYYCRNKIISESILNALGHDNVYFMECQKQLNHRLPLSAYLLSPIQRITKYHLLLGQLAKFTKNANQTTSKKISAIVILMANVVHRLNQCLENFEIVGVTDMFKYGPFIKFHNFPLKNDKSCQRYLFLFEKYLIVCKELNQNADRFYKSQYTLKYEFPINYLSVREEKNSSSFILNDCNNHGLYIVYLICQDETIAICDNGLEPNADKVFTLGRRRSSMCSAIKPNISTVSLKEWMKDVYNLLDQQDTKSRLNKLAENSKQFQPDNDISKSRRDKSDNESSRKNSIKNSNNRAPSFMRKISHRYKKKHSVQSNVVNIPTKSTKLKELPQRDLYKSIRNHMPEHMHNISAKFNEIFIVYGVPKGNDCYAISYMDRTKSGWLPKSILVPLSEDEKFQCLNFPNDTKKIFREHPKFSIYSDESSSTESHSSNSGEIFV
ncbi:hypothetical protein A3Q56_02531 [Intoshia linei]|uniref:DH domain-containing protein n=1 Tax=Intoshia linei TaxID=1819745 RepID=A0A177B616_9BILA|nr:hypothetical protein A3Q56_02531 [Intoshia linei]